MTNPPPIPFIWQGDGFEPASPYWAKRCDEYFVVGAQYRLIEEHERSTKSHRQYFAALKDAWDNLPMEQTALWPSVEHFRKYLLIKCGYRHERVIAAQTDFEARKIEALVGSYDQFAVIKRSGNIVTVWTAESQSMRAMNKERFQKSKTDVLDEAAALIGVTPDELRANTDKAA